MSTTVATRASSAFLPRVGRLVLVVPVLAIALLAWAWTGRNGVWGWAIVAWGITFLPLTFASGPRVFGLADLLVIGAYTWLGLEFARRAALAWQPRLRTPATALTVAITVAYVLTLATMPSYLAARAVS